jgi:opacity protein-like surface antigen
LDVPLWDAFGGFSILSEGGGTETNTDPVTGQQVEVSVDRQQSYGWQTAFAFNLTPVLGVVGDFGGQYSSLAGEDVTPGLPGFDVNVSQYQYLFGPRYNFRRERAAAFAHALIGGVRSKATFELNGDELASSSINGFAFGFGGGVDWNFGPELAVRVIQFDWIPSHFDEGWSNKDIRLGFGFVYRAIE